MKVLFSEYFMLNINDLLSFNNIPQLNDISLALYCDFSENVLLKQQFHYFFEDNSDIIIQFTEFGIRHMLAIHHIDGRISKNDLFNSIKNGLCFDDFSRNNSINQRFKKQKTRIRLFSCVYNSFRYGRVFYCPNQLVNNSTDIKMDYVIYRPIETKGLNIGIRAYQDKYIPLTILVSNQSNREKYINNSAMKIVKKLIISDISTGTTIDEITYADSFIMSNL